MIEFEWPWMMYLLPLPLVMRWLLPRASQGNDAALRVPYLRDFELTGASDHKQSPRRWPLLIYLLAWCCLLLAASRPQWVGDVIELPVSGRDLMLAIDLSASMDQRFAFRVGGESKLQATKVVAGEFIDRRVGDRIGLILFGEQAYVQAPLTFDRSTVKTLLNEAVSGLAGRATAIGDAIGLTVKRLGDSASQDHVLILLTDGVSNAGELDPVQAAEFAARKGLKIHSIGVGSRNNSDLNERALQAVARITGGRYFRAHDTRELMEIYAIIDQIEPVQSDTRSYRPNWALFYWPLGAALLLASVLGLLRQRGWT
jgi:Ca-activated chloride channel family protein